MTVIPGFRKISALEKQIDHMNREISEASEIVSAIKTGQQFRADRVSQASGLNGALLELWKLHSEIQIRERENDWADDGILRLEEIFKSALNSWEAIIDNALAYLVRHTRANQAAVFTLNEDAAEGPVLELTNAYAYGKKKYVTMAIDAEAGLVGECFLEGNPIYMEKVPEHYVKITSGLGEATPRTLILVPLIINGRKMGVAELAYFKTLEKFEIKFLERAANVFAAFIGDMKEKEKMKKLLIAAETASSQLRERESQLQHHMNEMQVMQEKLAAQNTMLEKTNRDLEAKRAEMERMKREEAELLDSKLRANDAIHETIVNRLKKKIQMLMEENQLVTNN